MEQRLRTTLVVIPALNEEGSVEAVIREVFEALPGCSCLVVDDGSTDSTAERARSAGALVARLPFNLGVGGAMRFGFRWALSHGFTAVVQVDADGQHDPAEVPRMLELLADHDLVIGARFAGRGEYVQRGPRRWAMRLLASSISVIASARLTDTTSGLRAAGPRAIALFAEDYPAEYLGDTVESLVIAARSGLRITQTAVKMRVRAAGTPSQNVVRSTMYLGRACLALVVALLRPRTKPAEAFS